MRELSLRQVEIVQLIALGRTTKEISTLLKISTRTVDSHRRQIYDKMRWHNLTDVVHYALAKRLIENKYEATR